MMVYFFVKVLKNIGERNLIKLIIEQVPHDELFGIGDDCAVIAFHDMYILLSTDIIAQKTHIPTVMKPWDIGWFITAINLSDLAAKGGTPLGFLLSVGLNPNMSVSDFKQIIKGVMDCASRYNTHLIGGDTKEQESNVLSGTIVGSVEKSCFMPRKGAQIGDVVVVTGSLGKAATGFIALQNNRMDNKILTGLIHPIPRLNEGIKLGKTGKVHCCMDLSDGLSSSLYQLVERNNIGFSIDMDKLPSSKSLASITNKKEFNVSYQDAVLHFGGDYELLFTCDPTDFPFLKTLFEPNFLHVIGSVTKTKDVLLIKNNEEHVLENKGYEHFSSHFFEKGLKD